MCDEKSIGVMIAPRFYRRDSLTFGRLTDWRLGNDGVLPYRSSSRFNF